MTAVEPPRAARAPHGRMQPSPGIPRRQRPLGTLSRPARAPAQLKGEGVDTRGPFSRPPYPSNRPTPQSPAVRSIVASGGQKPPFERQPSSGSWPTSVALVWLLPDACEPLRAQLNALKARGTLRFHLLTVMEAQDEKLRPDDPPRSQTMLLGPQVRWAGSVFTNHPARASSPLAKCRESSHVTISPGAQPGATSKAWTPTIRHPAARRRLLVACMIAAVSR